MPTGTFGVRLKQQPQVNVSGLKIFPQHLVELDIAKRLVHRLRVVARCEIAEA
jgi:hypothetical protein